MPGDKYGFLLSLWGNWSATATGWGSFWKEEEFRITGSAIRKLSAMRVRHMKREAKRAPRNPPGGS